MMGTIQIRNIPDDVIRTLKVRAAKSGQSLQEYMREHLIEDASKPTVRELMEEVRSRHDASAPDLDLETTLKAIDEGWE